jgi:hypothetical protein
VVIGLACTREGIPVRVWCWPGDTNDMTVLQQVKDDLRGWRLGGWSPWWTAASPATTTWPT